MQNHQIHYTLLKNIATHSKPRKARCLCRFPGLYWLYKSMNPRSRTIFILTDSLDSGNKPLGNEPTTVSYQSWPLSPVRR